MIWRAMRCEQLEDVVEQLALLLGQLALRLGGEQQAQLLLAVAQLALR